MTGQVWKNKMPWETSYTKKVVDDLEKVLGSISRYDEDYYAVQNAVQLLIQYHRDMHVPYDQRDEARKEREESYEVNRRLTQRLIDKDDELVRMYALHEVAKKTIADLRASLPFKVQQGQGRAVWCSPPDARSQEFMACGHYPNALSNYFEHRLHCEFCCEKEPLKWYDNGQHRQPKENQK